MATAKKESMQVSAYSRRLKENVKSILDNYAEILKASKVSVGLQRAHYCTIASSSEIKKLFYHATR